LGSDPYYGVAAEDFLPDSVSTEQGEELAVTTCRLLILCGVAEAIRDRDVGALAIEAASIFPATKAARGVIASVKWLTGLLKWTKATIRTAKATRAGTSIVKYDRAFAASQILGRPAVTPAGRQLTVEAARRVAFGGPGRPPTTLGYIDEILESGTRVVYQPGHPYGPTLKVIAEKLPGNPFAVLSAENPNLVITVMVPK
jgi:hypothetical protein